MEDFTLFEAFRERVIKSALNSAAIELYHLGGQYIQNYKDEEHLYIGLKYLDFAVKLLEESGNKEEIAISKKALSEGLSKLGKLENLIVT